VTPRNPGIPIGIVLTSFDAGGTERQMTELIRRIDRNCFDLRVACFRREGPWLSRVEAAGVPIDAFPLGSLTSWRTGRQLHAFSGWCRRHRLKVLQTCDIYGNIFALTGAALARVPVRIGSRRGIVSPTGRRSLLTLQRHAYRAAHRVVANSVAAGDALVGEGIPREKVVVIPNGIDLEPFAVPRTPGPASPQRTLGLWGGPGPVVTTVANLRPGKGHDVLLRAAAHVLRQRPDVRFQFVGDGPLRAQLEQEAEDLAIAAAVTFLGHRSDVAAILRGTAIFAFPSLMEAFPNGVMEAMAAELPVIASAVGGIPELVEHEHNGVLVPPGDDVALAAALLALLTDDTRARRLASAGRATIEQRYSFDRMVRDFEALYLDTLALRMSNAFPIPSRVQG
jgi:glycosyltransferase involved in cell wall biosynthesis